MAGWDGSAPAPGSVVETFVNQGHRDAVVLAVIGDQALLEYTMPKGTTALRIVTAGADEYRQVSYRDVPLKWLLAIDAAGQDWEGRPQQCGRWRPGTVAEAIVARRRAALVVE